MAQLKVENGSLSEMLEILLVLVAVLIENRTLSEEDFNKLTAQTALKVRA